MPSALEPQLISDRNTGTGLKATSDFSRWAASPISQGKAVVSARGLEDLSRATATPEAVTREAEGLSAVQKEQLKVVWQKAQLNGQNFGVDLKTLVPLFERKPEILDMLHSVATKDTLFTISKSEISTKAFETMRSEFLVEVIRGAVNPTILAQGETSTCTACKAISATSAENILKLSCSLALNGAAQTIGGDTVRLGTDRVDFLNRLLPYGQKVAGVDLQGDGTLNRKVGSINSRLPSLGMALVYAGLLEMKGGKATSEKGQFCASYTEMCCSLAGRDMPCALSGATISVNKSGQIVDNGEQGAKELTRVQYLDQKLAEISKNPQAKSILDQGMDKGNERGVLVDIKWTDVNPPPGAPRRHGRHFLLATALVERNGEMYYRLENPLGDYVDHSSKSGGVAHYFKPGVKQGDPKSISWLSGGTPEQENGDVGICYVKKSDFEKNLMALIVPTDKSYHAGSGKGVTLLGAPREVQSHQEVPVIFLTPTERPLFGSDSKQVETKVPQEQEQRKSLAELALEYKLEGMSKQPPNVASSRSIKAPDEEVLRNHDQLAEAIEEELRRARSSKDFLPRNKVTQTLAERLGNQTEASATPPPPPPGAPPSRDA